MTKQPEALRLADSLECGTYLLSVERDTTAAELRRLYEEVKCEERRFGELWEQFAALDKVNQELFEALRQIIALDQTEENEWDAVERVIPSMVEIAQTAIAKAEVQA